MANQQPPKPATPKPTEPEVTPPETPPEETKTSLEEVARQVLDGKFGVGQERRQRLAEAGHNPNEVQREVTRLLNQ